MKTLTKIKAVLKSDTKRNSLYSLVGNLMFAILGFASIAILARSLSIGDYGIWVIYLTSTSLVEMMRLGFMHTALVKFIAGKTESDSKSYIGGSWIIGLAFTFVTAMTFFTLSFCISEENSYFLFLKYYPLLAIINLPQVISLGILQAQIAVKKQILVKFLSMILSLVVFIASFYLRLEIETIITLHLLANAISSVIIIILGWSGVKYLFKATKSSLKELLNFGKFSIGTLIGTNLLKSADTFILALTLGSESAALYSIPLKLTETFEIILRSIINVALPKMAYFNNLNKLDEVKEIFQKFSGLLTIFYLPMMFFCFLFAENILELLAGEKYIEMANVFRVFTVFGLLLPIDRFTGVTLDCLNLPKLNMIKVFLMVICNVSLDIFILQFSSDLKLIALGTIITCVLGIFLGLNFINYKFETSLNQILKKGWNYWRTIHLNLNVK